MPVFCKQHAGIISLPLHLYPCLIMPQSCNERQNNVKESEKKARRNEGSPSGYKSTNRIQQLSTPFLLGRPPLPFAMIKLVQLPSLIPTTCNGAGRGEGAQKMGERDEKLLPSQFEEANQCTLAASTRDADCAVITT